MEDSSKQVSIYIEHKYKKIIILLPKSTEITRYKLTNNVVTKIVDIILSQIALHRLIFAIKKNFKVKGDVNRSLKQQIIQNSIMLF